MFPRSICGLSAKDCAPIAPLRENPAFSKGGFMRTPQSLRFFLIMLGCALPISPAYSQVTFLPPGAQLDGDAILDIVPGAQIKFSTFYGGGPIRLISYEAQWDTTELQLIFPTVVSATNPFPEHFQLPVGQLTFVHQNQRDQFGVPLRPNRPGPFGRSEEHTSELQSLMRISYAVSCLTKKTQHNRK